MRKRIIIVVIVILVLGVGLWFLRSYLAPTLATTAQQTPTPVNVADLGVVTAEGQVVPAETAALAFKIGGRVVAIPADEGTHVKQGDIIARLDDAVMQKQIAQAKAQLQIAQTQAGQADAQVQLAQQQLAQADTQVQLAQAQLAQVRAGGTDAATTAANAALSAAKSNYDKVKQGPTADELGQLKANLDSAQAAVSQAQSAYDRAGGMTNPFIRLTREDLALQQATNTYNAALAAYNDARSHPTASELAAANAQIQQARDALARLTPTQQALDVAQAQVVAAQAARETVRAQVGSAQAARDTAQVQVSAAQAALDLVNAQAADYVLVAPFDGTLAAKRIDVGEIVQPSVPAFDIGDLSRLQIETTDLAEVDVSQVNVGQAAKVTFDGLPGQTFQGKVKSIAPEANDHRGDQVYKATIDLTDSANPALRWGMTANLSIQVSQ